MTIAAVAHTLVTSKFGRYFKPGVSVQPNGDVDVDYATTTSQSIDAPWTVTLYSEQFNASGKLIEKPEAIATYDEPGGNGKQSFDFQYDVQQLSSTRRAVFWTQPVGSFATDQTTLEMQLLNSAGAKVGKPVALDILGGQSHVTDLYSEGSGTLPGFGKTFMVCYSTDDQSTGAAEIHFEELTDAGKAIKSGSIAVGNDGFGHGVDFGGYYLPGSGHAPDYMLIYRTPFSGSSLQVTTLTLTGTTGPINEAVTFTGPGGATPDSLNSYTFARPGMAKADAYGVLSETFTYDGGADNAIALQTIDATGRATHRAVISIADGFSSVASESAKICHVGNGDIVVGYNDGLASYLQEYNSDLVKLGKAIEISPPNSTGDLISIDALNGNRFIAFWRQDTSSADGVGYLHSEIFSASPKA